MGWLKMLAKGAAVAGAPFTGGATLAAIPAIDAIGAGMSAAADGMAKNRGAKTQLEMDKIGATQTGQRDMVSALLARDQAQQGAVGDSMRRLSSLSYLGDPAHQIQTPGLSTYSKALPGVPQGMSELAQNPTMLKSLMERATSQHDPLGGFMPTMPDFSGADKASKAGLLEKILGIGGAVAGAYGGMSGGGK